MGAATGAGCFLFETFVFGAFSAAFGCFVLATFSGLTGFTAFDFSVLEFVFSAVLAVFFAGFEGCFFEISIFFTLGFVDFTTAFCVFFADAIFLGAAFAFTDARSFFKSECFCVFFATGVFFAGICAFFTDFATGFFSVFFFAAAGFCFLETEAAFTFVLAVFLAFAFFAGATFLGAVFFACAGFFTGLRVFLFVVFAGCFFADFLTATFRAIFAFGNAFDFDAFIADLVGVDFEIFLAVFFGAVFFVMMITVWLRQSPRCIAGRYRVRRDFLIFSSSEHIFVLRLCEPELPCFQNFLPLF